MEPEAIEEREQGHRAQDGSAGSAAAAVDERGQAREQERLRLQQKGQELERMLARSRAELAGVIDPVDAGQAPGAAPLVESFGLAAHDAGIALALPPGAHELTSVEDLAAAAGVRVRKVALRGRWWCQDGGALVGNKAEGGAPVALIPVRGGRGYRLHCGGQVRAVDEAVAAELADFAYCLYRPPPPGRLTLGRLAAFALRGLGPDVRLLFGLGLALLLLGLAAPVATGLMIDTVIPSASSFQAWQLTAVLLLVAATTTVLEFVRAVALVRIETRMDGTMQAAMWDRVLRLPVPFFRRFAVGDLAMRLQSIEELRRALSGGTIATLLGGAFSLGNFLLLVYYSGKLALVAAGCAAVVLLFMGANGYFRLRAEREVAHLGGQLSARAIEFLAGIGKLRVAAAETRAWAIWTRMFAHARRLSFRAGRLGALDDVFFAAWPTLASALVFAVMGSMLAQGGVQGMSTGQFVAFHAAFGAFLAGLASVAGTLLDLLRLVPVAERAAPVLHALPEAGPDKRHPGRLHGRIEVRDLSFRYGDGPQVLDKVSLSIAPGSFVALVGPSGSGKSTLLRLLLGFEQPTAGVISYDAQDLAELDVAAVRRQLGVVLQHGQLLSGSIYQNIAGARELPLEQAQEAARLCALEDDLQAMPMGMHTVISEGCSTLSGGQRQRILIARAVAHRPKILFFDEATSALDNRTQAQIARSLEQVRATRIVVAHRLSTIQQADEIIVLDGGRIVQRGSYAALMDQPGLFVELAKRQLA